MSREMARPRFIAIVGRTIGRNDRAIDPRPGTGIEGARNRLAALDGFAALIDRAGLFLASTGAHLACGPQGIILGSLFKRGTQHAVTSLSAEDQAGITDGRGLRLVNDFWGPYVAFLPAQDGARCDILRAPLGELPCYRLERDRCIILASDVDLLRDTGLYAPTIDRHEVIRSLTRRYIHMARTCLADLDALQGGERLTVAADGHHHTETLWSPWTFAARERQITDSADAARMLRETVLDCVAARASQFDAGLLTLSGGLDSSIVARALHNQGASFAALNLVTMDKAGDESQYAQQVTAALGVDLTLGLREVARIDVRRSLCVGQPRPAQRGFLQESQRLAEETAVQSGAQVLFNGAGGDNVFCSLQSGAPVADRLLSEGIGKGVLATAMAMSAYAPASIFAVLNDGIRRAWFGKPAFRQDPDLALLSDSARALPELQPSHPWLTAPRGTLPGKAMHVRTIAFGQSYVESLDSLASLPVVAPLLSQPLVELCLRIPSWLWLGSGHNRFVARQAFRGLLPETVLWRRSKGGPDSFIAEIFETHRTAIRAMLEDGYLARHYVIDLPATLALIDAPGLLRGEAHERILEFIDFEAWAASWPSA